ASALFGCGAVSAEVELAVQAGRGVVGHEEEGCTSTRRLLGREPSGVPGAIGLVEARDGRRVDLDLPAWGTEGVAGRIVPKGTEISSVVGKLRQCKVATLPELFEAGRIKVLRSERVARTAVEMLQPFPRRAPLSEGLCGSEPIRQA